MSKKKNPANVPVSPPPPNRRDPLPWQTPKSLEDDPASQDKLRAILDSPTYLSGCRDLDFLTHDETRGIRLELDYYKPEYLLREAGIEHTIVVFGSTRIVERQAAEHQLERARKALDQSPDDTGLQHKVSVAEKILAKSHYYDVAREFARLVAMSGEGSDDPRLAVMTGGGPGMMEAANRGASDAGAKTVGLNITLPHEQFPNPYLSPELCFQFHYFSIRKMHLVQRARALIAFPGGYGTLDELFETLTLIQTRKIKPIPVVLVGESYWRKVFDIDFLVDEGVIDLEDRDLFWFAESAEEIWQELQEWYRLNGEELVPAR